MDKPNTTHIAGPAPHPLAKEESGVFPTTLGGTFATANTEYRFRDGECTVVTDRRTGRQLLKHPALRGSLQGAISHGVEASRAPRHGDSLVIITAGGDQLITSAVLSVEPLRVGA